MDKAIEFSWEGSLLLSIKDQTMYAGQYVCFPSFAEHRIISSHINATEAMIKAKKRGYKNPVIFYVPRLDEKLVLPGTGLRCFERG